MADDLGSGTGLRSTASEMEELGESFLQFEEIDLREEAGKDYEGKERQKTSDLPLKAQILLGPIHKYRLMGVFPWPFLVHVLLALADSYWIVYMNNMNASFISQQKLIWYFKFSNPGIERNEYAYERRRTFHDVEEMRSQIQDSLNFYWSLRPATEESLADADITQSTQRFLCQQPSVRHPPAGPEREEATDGDSGGDAIYGLYRAFPLRCGSRSTSLPVIVSFSIPTRDADIAPELQAIFDDEKYRR